MLNKLYWILSAILILIVSIAAFYWLQSRSTRGLNLELNAPEKIFAGVPFDLEIDVSNDSSNVLKDVKLYLNIPESLAFLGSSPGKTVEYKNLGNLGVSSLTKESFKLIALSGENSSRRIEAVLSYSPASLDSRFEISKTFDMAIGETGISINLEMPEKIISGEDFEISVSYKNISDIDFSDLKLSIEYPPTFSFKEAALKPDIGDNIWNLGDLRKGSENKFKIKGNLIGPDNAFFDFKANTEADFLGKSYVVNGAAATLSISSSPLSVKIFLNESEDYIAKPGDILNYSIDYYNNTGIGLKDAVIKAKLIGEMFDFTALNTNADFRPGDNTLTWNASNLPQLSVLPAGASGTANFQIKVKDVYPIRRLGDKNFVLKVEATAGADKVTGLAISEIKVAGQIKIDTKVYFRDAESEILNKGPMPPKVGQPTNFTVHWLIANFGTDVNNVEVRAFLEGNVRMIVDKTKSNISSSPSYNEGTQEVVWTIDRIPATRGVIDAPIEAILQIEATPSASLAGRYMPLIKETSIMAIDDFTGQKLSSSNPAVTTALPDDTTVGSQGGIVTK